VTWPDEATFAAFYERTARGVWAYVYRASGNSADADDIVQEAFCRLATADVKGLSEEDRRRYVFRIAGNLMTDRWRRSSREQSWLNREAKEPPPAAPPDPLQGDGDVARTFGYLKPRERALLWLAYVEEEDHQSIAASLGVKRGSVKVMLSRARTRLRDLLKAKGIGGSYDEGRG
jgi:RNA polymerase sigma-70 factor, ECF subfamily